MKFDLGFVSTIKRELKRLCSRPMFAVMMIVVPIGCAFFFFSLLGEGLPLKVPSAVVDLDHSAMSRQVTRSLDATELVDITEFDESYVDAMASIRRGDTYGFFVIPANFESDVMAGKQPTVSYYYNMTYFVPGTFTFKGFKSIAVATAAEVVKVKIESMGLEQLMGKGMIQPVSINSNPIGNPWTNYSYYLCPSFIAGVLALMIILVTIFSVTTEIKAGTSAEWLHGARDSILVAVTGKLLPQAAVFALVGVSLEAVMFKFLHFPMNGSLTTMIAAMLLFVVACQGFALFITCVVPNPRLALSVGSLLSILAFSFAGFSFPVQTMSGGIGVFSYIVPVRYFYLIYNNVALNGLPLYYSRLWMAALIVFPLLPLTMLWRLKRWCLKPVYVP